MVFPGLYPQKNSCLEFNTSVNFAICFRAMRSFDHSKILVGLSLNLMALLITFIAGLESTSRPDDCRAVALILHYLLLSSFGWMAGEAVTVYRRLVKIFGSYISHYLVKLAILAQGNRIKRLRSFDILSFDQSMFATVSKATFLM